MMLAGEGENALSSGSPRATPYGKRGLRAAICGLLALSLPAAGARQKAAKKHGCDVAPGGDVCCFRLLIEWGPP